MKTAEEFAEDLLSSSALYYAALIKKRDREIRNSVCAYTLRQAISFVSDYGVGAVEALSELLYRIEQKGVRRGFRD